MQLKIFDVEHGACALLTCDNGQRLMIDCGHNATTAWKPGDYLNSIGVNQLELLVVTNCDEDHVSGLPNLLSRVTVRSHLHNPTLTADVILQLKSDTGVGPGVKLLASALRTAGGALSSTPYSPELPWANWNAYWNHYPSFDDENNLSLALHLNLPGGRGFLFPGDLECAGWKQLLKELPGFRAVVKSTKVLVASHHGRLSGVCAELFDDYGCAPQIVVISDDYHQYQTQQTISYYAGKCSGLAYFRTDGPRSVLTTRNDGTLTFNWHANGGCIVSWLLGGSRELARRRPGARHQRGVRVADRPFRDQKAYCSAQRCHHAEGHRQSRGPGVRESWRHKLHPKRC